MDFENVRVVGLEANYHERLFLEAWHSTEDPNAGNDHIKIPEAYKCIARAFSKLTILVTCTSLALRFQSFLFK